MSSVTISKRGGVLPGEAPIGGVNFTDRLASVETITGTPTVAVAQLRGTVDADGITVTGPAVNAAAATIDGQTVAIGKGVLFTVTCAADAPRGAIYQLTISITTSEGQPLKDRVNVAVL